METQTLHTPSPGGSINTPGAPGFSDWRPYSPTTPQRKSARLQQRAAKESNRTPSPVSDSRRPYSTSDPRSPRRASPRSKQQPSQQPSQRRRQLFSDSIAMASPALSPQKKRPSAAADPSRRVSGNLTVEGTVAAAAALGLASKSLPTPAKTPQKPPTEQKRASISAVARNLFHGPEDVMPSPQRQRRNGRYTLDSFDDGVEEPPIEIYTDRRERLPVIDPSAENPFYGSRAVEPQPEPTKRTRATKKQQDTVMIPGEGLVTIEEAIRRNDGMLIVFRGKKQFRKFAPSTEEVEDGDLLDVVDGGLDSAVESRLRRPLTRSSVKPKLLFPPSNKASKRTTTEEDEEAVTDIEDHVLASMAEEERQLQEEHDEVETPAQQVDDESPDTPKAPRYAPASPPDTKRTTRFTSRPESTESIPMKAVVPRAVGKRSPFGWRQTKKGSDADASDSSDKTAKGHKRRADDALSTGPAKRTRA